MEKRLYMMKEDPYLCNTILFMCGNDIDKTYDIFVELHAQEYWRIADIEKRL